MRKISHKLHKNNQVNLKNNKILQRYKIKNNKRSLQLRYLEITKALCLEVIQVLYLDLLLQISYQQNNNPIRIKILQKLIKIKI